MTQEKIKTDSMDFADLLSYNRLEEGIIYLNETIYKACIENLEKEILTAIKEFKRDNIELRITSNGGEVYPAFAIYDMLRNYSQYRDIQITGIAEGIAASAASMIVLQGCDNRLSRKNTRFLLHEPSRWSFFKEEKTSDLADEKKEMDMITNQIIELLAERCDHTIEEVRNLIERKEIWMSAQEALEWNLIDGII